MKTFYSLLLCVFLACGVKAQPWNSPLMICTSTDGLNFGAPSVFQDSSGVATILNLGGDTLITAFQWFPYPLQSTYFDKVAVKFSYDGGATWTDPTPCNFSGTLPNGYQRPFDPAIVKLSNGQIRMYFSTGINFQNMGDIDTYSAVSTDGINYVYESGSRIDHATLHSIDPAAIFFNSVWYYTSWTSVSTDGSHRGTSTDGLTFTMSSMLPYDGSHTWLGGYCVDGNLLRFYGSGNGLWTASTTDGINWGPFTSVNVMGGDPVVTKNDAGTYIMIYTGPPNLSSVSEFKELNVANVFPNPASEFIRVELTSEWLSAASSPEFVLYNAVGEIVVQKYLSVASTEISTGFLSSGIYFYEIREGEVTVKVEKLVITN